MSTEAITSAALALPPESRAELAETLLRSLDSAETRELAMEWEREIERRVKAFERGEIKTFSEEEVTRDVRSRAQP